MSSPPLTIERGEGWSEKGWETNAHRLEFAASRAKDWIDSTGIIYLEPKLGIIHRTANWSEVDDRLLGTTHDVSRYSIFMDTKDDQNPISVRELASWSAVMVHESTHCVRLEYETLKNTLHLIATEGIAYPAEMTYAKSLNLTWANGEFIGLDHSTPDPLLMAGFKSRSDDGGAIYEWANTCEPNQGFDNGVRYGAQMVNRHLAQGVSLARIIQMPAEEILCL